MKHAAAAEKAVTVTTTSAEHTTVATSGFHASTILHNPETWLIVAFVIFIAIFAKFVFPMIAKALDKRADDIRFQLEQATRLRAQAEALLATYEAERTAKLQEAEEILASAKRDAEALRVRANADLTQSLDRRSQQAVEKIERAEQEAVSFIRTQMVDVATQAVRNIVRNELDGNAEDQSISRAIKAIESQIH